MNSGSCLKCGKSLENKRKDAIYCGDACRMSFNRGKLKQTTKESV